MKILIIEDEALLAEGLKALLELRGFEVETVSDGENGAEYAESGSYDLLILDVMMPGLDGFSLARRVRARRVATPILMLTARGGVQDRIEGLNAGADYYLTKPFDNRELLACVNALLRRQGAQIDLPEQPPLYLDRTPLEYLGFVGRAKGLSKAALDEQIDRVMSVTQITDVSNRLIKNLSKGYRQRVGIAQALLGDPKVVILDEPTVGLDPIQIIEIRDLIKSLGREHTVILSSHILSEVQAVCQTILIISKGKLVACDTAENLERLFAGTAAVELTVEAGAETAQGLLAGLGHVTALHAEPMEGGRCGIRLETDTSDGEGICRECFHIFSRAGLPILRMDTTRASLEDIFIELTGDRKEAEEA